VLAVPGCAGSVVVLARGSGGASFTQQDSTVARLYLRGLAEPGTEVAAQLHGSGWTRQLETIQRIAARLTRLASVEEVGSTICNETRSSTTTRRRYWSRQAQTARSAWSC